MQGVEILTSTQVVTEWGTNRVGFWITFIVVFGIFAIIGFNAAIEEQNGWNLIGFIFVGIISGMAGGVLVGCILLSTPIVYETQHKVTTSEEVSLIEFYEHYEVIDQDGKIFTVRERTNEE